MFIAALVFGGTAGFWFATSGESLHRLIALGAALLAILLGALDYDFKIFERITKFNGGGVSLELTGDIPQYDNTSLNQLALAEHQGGPFSGAARVDFAILVFGQLGDWSLRDSQYAHLFANDSKIPQTYDDYIRDKNPLLISFIYKNCGFANVVSRDLFRLQAELRSERPFVSTFEIPLRSVRDSFYLEDPKARLEALTDAFYRLGILAKSEITKVKPRDPSQSFPNNGNCKTFLKNAYDKDPQNADRWEDGIPPNLVGKIDKNAVSVFRTYHAILVAAGLFALGDREGAIQLLGQEAKAQVEELTKYKADMLVNVPMCADNPLECRKGNLVLENDKVMLKRLDQFRRLVSVVRLYNLIDNLFDVWDEDANRPARLSLLIDLVDKMNLAFIQIKSEDSVAPILFKNPAHNGKVFCFERNPDHIGQALLARWAAVRVFAIYNTLDALGSDPNLLSIHSNKQKMFDDWANYIEAFDLRCDNLYEVNGIDKSAGALFVRSAGDYWNARAENLLADPITRDDPIVTKYLCSAKTDYETAYTMSTDLAPNINDQSTDLDARKEDYKSKIQSVLIKAALSRVNSALEKIPMGQRDKYCRS